MLVNHLVEITNHDYFTTIHNKKDYQINLIEKGLAVIHWKNQKELITAPAVICFKKEQDLKLIDQIDLKTKTLCFSTDFLNPLDISKVRTAVDLPDYHLLKPLFYNDSQFIFELHLDQMKIKKII